MATDKDIQAPPLSLNESRLTGCITVADGALTYYIDRLCKRELLWSCWYNYAASPSSRHAG